MKVNSKVQIMKQGLLFGEVGTVHSLAKLKLDPETQTMLPINDNVWVDITFTTGKGIRLLCQKGELKCLDSKPSLKDMK